MSSSMPFSVSIEGGKQYVIPRHDALAEELHAYIAAAGIDEERKGWLFRTAKGCKATMLSGQPLSQADAWRMIRWQARAAGIKAPNQLPHFPCNGDHGILGEWRNARAGSSNGCA